MSIEEIREGIREVIEYHFGLRLADKTIDDIFIKMASQGVVIKIPVAPPIGGSAKMCCYEELIAAGRIDVLSYKWCIGAVEWASKRGGHLVFIQEEKE